MNYKILYTEIDPEDKRDRLIKILNENNNETIFYYVSEIRLIGNPDIQKFLFRRLKFINIGAYDELTII